MIIRHCFSELGNMAPQVGDEVAHIFNDLGLVEGVTIPGWADGVVKSVSQGAGTFKVLYSDGLCGEATELNVADYGEDKAWVLLMKTVKDKENRKLAHGGLTDRCPAG